ncbi:MAG: UTP-GlnB uridylyltransferase, GlnD [Desulfomicrobiaceae bacterium]|jgi:[protein-PII] uridylyltransferase|nr:UTP-GlnB uridylyltransferase, GlnD [Desulfomicrobiaceae bacterium]
MERALSRIMTAAVAVLAQGFPGCVLAVGGFGLSQLSPGSDLDICLLRPPRLPAEDSGRWVQSIVYPLWDSGMQVDYSVRTLAETLELAAQDPKVLAGLLSARPIGPDPAGLFPELRQGVRRILTSAARRTFVQWIAETSPSGYACIEPDLKNSPGGLRHWHHLGWLAAAFPGREGARFLDLGVLAPDQVKALCAAAQTIRQVRCALHCTTQRRHDVFSAELQDAVAHRLGTSRPALSQRLEEAMARIRLARCAMVREVLGRIERKRRPPDRRCDGIRHTPGGLGFAEDPGAHPHLVLRLIETAAHTGIPPNFSAQGALLRLSARQAAELSPHLAVWLHDILHAPHGEAAFATLLDLGLLRVLFPELAPSLSVVPLDGWHRHPVGWHSLRCAMLLAQPQELLHAAPWLETLPTAPKDHLPLVWAGLLHDMGKPHPRHEVRGSILARRLLTRLGVAKADIATTTFLIAEHLTLFQVATQRDLNDPATIHAVAHKVQTPERLAALARLAVADAMATGPAAWNTWRSLLVEELYAKTARALQGRPLRAPSRDNLPQDFLREIPEPARERISSSDLRRMAELFARQRSTPQILHTLAWSVHDQDPRVWKCAVMAPDQPALFATLAGCFAIKGADILSAEIFTTREGTAMDLFVVRLPETDAVYFWPAFTEEARTSLADPHGLATRIAARRKSPLRRPSLPGPKPQVRLDAEKATLVVRASDRPGRLFDITWELALHGVNVQAAKIATHGDHIHDIFFLQQASHASWRLSSTLQPLLAAILRRLQTE